MIRDPCFQTQVFINTRITLARFKIQESKAESDVSRVTGFDSHRPGVEGETGETGNEGTNTSCPRITLERPSFWLSALLPLRSAHLSLSHTAPYTRSPLEGLGGGGHAGAATAPALRRRGVHARRTAQHLSAGAADGCGSGWRGALTLGATAAALRPAAGRGGARDNGAGLALAQRGAASGGARRHGRLGWAAKEVARRRRGCGTGRSGPSAAAQERRGCGAQRQWRRRGRTRGSGSPCARARPART